MNDVLLLSTHSGCGMVDSIIANAEADNSLSSLRFRRAQVHSKKFANGEVYSRIEDNVRGRNVYVFMSGENKSGWSVNDTLIETIILLDACKRADVASITLICPCFPYIRQDKKLQSREPISAKAIASCFEKYVNRVAVVDSHFSQFQGFFDVPVDNLYAIYGFCKYLSHKYLGLNGEFRENYVLISPDGGGAKRIEHYARLLGMNHVIMNKKRDYTKSNSIICTELYNESTKLDGRYGIIIDDIIDTAGTITASCRTLDRYGLRGYILIATHGLFSGKGVERIEDNEKIVEVIVTDSVTPPDHEKITVLSISDLLYKFICELETGGSISSLFQDMPIFESPCGSPSPNPVQCGQPI